MYSVGQSSVIILTYLDRDGPGEEIELIVLQPSVRDMT
jgi:hypothetical protein